MNYILSIFSFILYYCAPSQYSFEFSVVCLVIFLINSYQLIRNDSKKIGVVNFNTIFLVSFFLCSYAFPVLLLPIGEIGYFYETTVTGLEEYTINKTTALNTFTISIYTIAYFSYRRKEIKEGTKISLTPKFYRVLRVLLIIVSIALIASIQLFSRSNKEAVSVTSNPFLYVLFYVLLTIFLVSVFTQSKALNFPFITIVRKNLFVLGLIFIIVLLHMVVGDRGPILTIGLILIGSYAVCYKKIKTKNIFFLALVGFFILAFIGITRGGDSSIRLSGFMGAIKNTSNIVSGKSLWFLFEDFTGRYMEINCGYKYTLDYGYLYPFKIIPIIFSPFPLIPSLLSHLFYGVPFADLSSVKVINETLFSDRDGWMGTHCVIDAYMSWGIIGVIIIYAIIGRVFAYISSNSKNNILLSSLYVILLSCSLYMPRAIFFEFYRPFSWVLIIFYILIMLSNSHVYRYKL